VAGGESRGKAGGAASRLNRKPTMSAEGEGEGKAEPEVPAEVPIVAVVAEEGSVNEKLPVHPPGGRDRSNDDVFDKFVVCIVDYSWLVILITVGISLTLGFWTLDIIYEQGAERTFAFGDGNADRDDLRTTSYEAVAQAQRERK
jgi:hypothetical protein